MPRTQYPSRLFVGGIIRVVVILLLAQSFSALFAAWSQAEQITGPRDLLRLYDIDDSQIDALVDGQPLDAAEREILLRIMFRLPSFSQLNLDKWAREQLDPAALQEGSKAFRGQIFRLKGRVTDVELRRLDPKTAELFNLPHYYRCRLILEGDHPVVVLALEVPKQWQNGGKVEDRKNQRATAQGMLLKLSAPDDEDPDDEDPNKGKRPVPLLLAQRIAWYPNTPLGELGMDVGLLDCVKNQERITDAEREGFYQMLAAVGRAEPGQLSKEAKRILQKSKKDAFSVVPLFNEPKEQIGRLFELTGTARRVVRVRVGDPDIRSRFRIDHYYEIAVFTSDSQQNPIVFCVRELPEGMPVGEGGKFREQVSIAGFYFKKYAYVIELPGKDGQPRSKARSQEQFAPLLIGRRPVWYPRRPAEKNTLFGAIAGGLFVLAIVGIWLAVWRYGRADKRFQKITIARNYAMDPGISLDEIGLDAQAEPDFNAPAEMDHPDSTGEKKQDDETAGE